MNAFLGGMSAVLLLSACASPPDPEPYMGFACEQLKMMLGASGPVNPFAANQVGPEPQSGLIGDRQGLATENTARPSLNDGDMRVIRAAFAAKNCQ